ncbi:Rossmann fold nucleotide-binding protein Smf possibly involved in DNA uptake [hydrothermal vent metagenome]|uniref:Rossmann fold nucleotide-binding protein Smf possibly involved in DNA uptake n=1 Tax=hydrothermal vent metagenome TaxID=652676 RepID=A0A3B1DZV7_9ZZZZ
MNHSVESTPELLAAMRLNMVNGVGPRMLHLLQMRFGSPADVLAASKEELLSIQGIGHKLANSILATKHSNIAEEELQRCAEFNVQLVLRTSDNYPAMLEEISDPPNILYCKGDLLPQDHLAVAIVGSRRCTMYGKQQAEHFAGALARAGVTVVSGLARGIDAAAHTGALKAGGRTIAVLATGIANIYPPEHDKLAEEVAASGAVVTESPLRQKPLPGLFPQRNRIISGLSLGTIIIEASRKSGALHTARHAMEQGREIFVLPGRVDSLASQGCHDLIRDGAILIRNIDDVLCELGPLTKPVNRPVVKTNHSKTKIETTQQETIITPRELTLSDQEREILNLVSLDQKHIDEVLREATIEHSRVLATLTILEMKRLIRKLPGGYLVRVTY